jgi:NAD(P)-dependent dehydrogenase (short-subunit alcohol dehydrogenase family)
MALLELGFLRKAASSSNEMLRKTLMWRWSNREEEAKDLKDEIKTIFDWSSERDLPDSFASARFVSNAGILTRGTIDSYSLEVFDRIVVITLRAAFVGLQAAARPMKDGGRIVLIGSNTAIRTAFPGHPHISAQ